jgi:hypothetical protein
MRVVLPPWWVVLFVFAGLFVCETLVHVIARGAERWHQPLSRSMELVAHRPRDGWLVAALAAYGFYRVVAMHPLFRQEYSQWLSQTPWSERLPLPLGPVNLIPQDGVVFFFFWLWTWHASILNSYTLLAALLIPYLLAIAIAMRVMGVTVHAYLIMFGLGMAVWLRIPSAAALTLAATYVVAMHGLLNSLRGIAWDVSPRLWRVVRPLLTFKKIPPDPSNMIDFPIVQLSPKPEFEEITGRESLAVAGLSAWWLYIVASFSYREQTEIEFGYVAAGVILVGTAIVRCVIYFREYRAPVSLLGRLVTRQWIIPAYDRAWLPMVLAVLMALAAYSLAELAPLAIGGPICLAIGMAILLGMPPSMRVWALTGNHRIVANPTRRNEFIEL